MYVFSFYLLTQPAIEAHSLRGWAVSTSSHHLQLGPCSEICLCSRTAKYKDHGHIVCLANFHHVLTDFCQHNTAKRMSISDRWSWMVTRRLTADLLHMKNCGCTITQFGCSNFLCENFILNDSCYDTLKSYA